ncbi:MAG: glycosyltransferase family 2 protein [Peptococcaceae bacterium]|nr:glycosyltransferase family 2 protein [Peptococcaceae bacterium]
MDILFFVLQKLLDVYKLTKTYSPNTKIQSPPKEQNYQPVVFESSNQNQPFQNVPKFPEVKNGLSVNKDNRTRSLLEQITNPSIIDEIIEGGNNAKSVSSPPPPFISFATFNRLGLTVRNLNRILASKDDFEMHIIDCNSKDNTWDYIKSLNDSRIKSKTRFKANLGPIFVLNYNLTKRKPNQYFFTIDSDVYIKTEDWLKKYLEVFEAFPEVGLLGVMRDNPYPRFLPPVIPRVKGDLSYLELKNAQIDCIMDFVPGHLQALRPELIKEIGYWSEENGYGDAEISPRIVHYTSFKAGFLTNVEIDMTQTIGCNQCEGRKFCKLNRSINTCYMLSKKSNMNESFAKQAKWKYLATFKELEEGKRTAYCASILDPESRKKHLYHESWALENFEYYFKKSN